MNAEKQPAVAGPVEPTVRPGLPVVGCVWNGVAWLVSLRSPKKLDLGARLYTEAELDAAVAAERERIINALPGGHSVDPQWVADMVRNGA